MPGGSGVKTQAEMMRSVRLMHLDALKGLRREIDGERFSQLTHCDFIVRAEILRAHFSKMGEAHTVYRQCVTLSSDEIYNKARSLCVRALAKVENRIKELEQSRTHPAANSTMNMAEQLVYRVEQNRRPQIGKFNGKAAM